MHSRLNAYADEHRRLCDIAIQAFYAVRSGNVGLTGTTGNLLTQTLGEMQSLGDRNLPQIHLIAESTTVASR